MRMKVAEIGNVIEFGDGIQGLVEKVYENSVLVDLTYEDNSNKVGVERTVVNHKKYKIVKTSVAN
jgi:uncharacterized protein YkvS